MYNDPVKMNKKCISIVNKFFRENKKGQIMNRSQGGCNGSGPKIDTTQGCKGSGPNIHTTQGCKGSRPNTHTTQGCKGSGPKLYTTQDCKGSGPRIYIYIYIKNKDIMAQGQG